MKIALNILPLQSAHQTRGIGSYTKNLLQNLKKISGIEVQEFINLTEVRKVDIVHFPWYDLFFNTLPFRKKFNTVVTIHDVMPLVFSQNYHPSWQAKISDDKKRINDDKHFKVNGFANGWLIDKEGDFRIELEYKTQKLYNTNSNLAVTIIRQ